MADNSHAYNSVWQLRGDSWCRLEEAADRLTRTTTTGALKDQYIAICKNLLNQLTPLEPYWAYPGSPQFAMVHRLFTAGSYDKFAHAVTRINRALTTESYRTGEVDTAGLNDTDMFPADPRQLEQQPATRREQLYFEVLVVESMTEAQERALRREVRGWRRPDDEFVYELVVVSSGDEALIAARLNANLQAVVIRRRFSHQSTRDLSTLAEFVDTHVSDELADHQSPDERAQILATSLAQLRPELDLYLMTEIEVEDIAGRLGHVLPTGVPRAGGHARAAPVHPAGVAARYRTPFFSALQAVQPPADRRVSRAADLAGQVDRQLALDQRHGRLLRPRRLHGRDVGHLRWARLAARADRPAARGAATGCRGIRIAADLLRHERHLDGQQDRRPSRWWRPGDIVLLDRNCHQSHHYGHDAGRRQRHLPGGVPAERVLDVRRGSAARDQVKAAGAAARRQARPGQDDDADQLHLRRHRLRRRAGHGGMSGDQARPGVPVGRGVVRLRPLPPGLPYRVPRWRPPAGCGNGCRTRTTRSATRSSWPLRRETPPTDDELLNRRLIPDPAKARVRVYATQSTHKTLTSLRQGSMIHVFDQDFEQKVAEAFHEAYMAHTSTSPNYQILASLDLGRRQVALEGVELVQRQIENAMQLRDAIDNHPLLSKYMALPAHLRPDSRRIPARRRSRSRCGPGCAT